MGPMEKERLTCESAELWASEMEAEAERLREEVRKERARAERYNQLRKDDTRILGCQLAARTAERDAARARTETLAANLELVTLELEWARDQRDELGADVHDLRRELDEEKRAWEEAEDDRRTAELKAEALPEVIKERDRFEGELHDALAKVRELEGTARELQQALKLERDTDPAWRILQNRCERAERRLKEADQALERLNNAAREDREQRNSLAAQVEELQARNDDLAWKCQELEQQNRSTPNPAGGQS